MPIEGYKETLLIDGVEHTPLMIRDKIQGILRTTRISQDKFWAVMDLCQYNQIWLDQYVREREPATQTMDELQDETVAEDTAKG